MIDRTTRIALVVIAACLVLLTIKTFQATPVIATGYAVDIRRLVDIVRSGRPVSWRDFQQLGR